MTKEVWAQWVQGLSEEQRKGLGSALRAHASRQLATVAACGAALTHGPSLDERIAAAERAREELMHFEVAAEVYTELGYGDLMEEAQKHPVPVPNSWVESAVAQYCLCLAAQVDLEPYERHEGAISEIVLRVLADEREHVRAAIAMLRESEAVRRGESFEALFDRWATLALASIQTSGAREQFETQSQQVLRSLSA